MLRSLTIKNLALFKSQEIEFDRGLNVILGETGAGKSLIFDALFFVLSVKTDKSLLRTGEDVMRVDAVFQPLSSAVHEILQQNDLDDNELIISRTLHADGRSSSKVNGSPCPQSMIKNLSAALVDSFTQHENMDILKSKNHLMLLDRFCDFGDLKTLLARKFEEIKDVQKRIAALGGDAAQREDKKDMLNYQIAEIENAKLKLGEDEMLDEKIKLLESAEKIGENLNEVLRMFSSAGGVLSNLNSSAKLLSKLSDIAGFDELANRIESAQIELDDVTSEIKERLLDSQADPIELDRLNERKVKIKSLKRKYGSTIEEILNKLNQLKQNLDDLIDAEDGLAKLEKQKQEIMQEIQSLCEQIHQIRQQGAQKVKQGLEREFSDLGMAGSRFEVNFERKQPSTTGFDDVSFVFSANKGQALKDLAKTASGGESSRIMLAMKNMFASKTDERTLLFDEIDSGISGEVGNMMAAKLSSISLRDQVLAITHLPQVASAGDVFIKVEKFSDQNSTFSKTQCVSGKDAIKEIAHIIGGNNITDVMLANAEQLFERGRRK